MKFIPVSIKPIPIRILFITPSPANNILRAKERNSSLIQNGITRETINNESRDQIYFFIEMNRPVILWFQVGDGSGANGGGL